MLFEYAANLILTMLNKMHKVYKNSNDKILF